jgi:leucyl-tRNA synthetase
MYSRFWHKVLYDLGDVSTKEPFSKLRHQGTILGEDSRKMSKSLGNVVNPDDVVREYGADAVRLFEMFMGPLEVTKPWSTRGVDGVHRFLNRAWRMMLDEEGKLLPSVREGALSADQERLLHETIHKVTTDIEGLNFNTAISQLMIFVNEFLNLELKPRAAMETFTKLLAPFAPHIAEELWAKLGHAGTIAYEPWPQFSAEKMKRDTVELVIQVNGKVRAKLNVEPGLSDERLRALALEEPGVRRHIDGKAIERVVVVKNRLVSFVVR